MIIRAVEKLTQTALIALANVTADVTGAGKDITSYKGSIVAILDVVKVAGNSTTFTSRIQATGGGNAVGHVVAGTNTGTGTITEVEAGPDAVAEGWSVSLANAVIATVTGNITGAIAVATVGTYYDSAYLKFRLTAGATAFAPADTFDVRVVARAWANVHHFTVSQSNGASVHEKVAINIDSQPKYLRGVIDVGTPGAANHDYKAGIYIYGITE